ncbi:hypothetical protein [Candidatus Phytoplasma palmae]|uniref:hypothetical protein n=1 Tax=Candidatus Phytoplasma palmae TaxID=85624 RepID=UPI003990A27F
MNNYKYLLDKFKIIIKNKKLTHFYLIEGKNFIEQKKIAIGLIYEFFKTENHSEKLKKCIEKLCYPNIYHLGINEEEIKKEHILNMQKYFFHTSFFQKKKVCLIAKAENISYQASHSLLYLLENPVNENFLFLLLTSDRYLLIPTIVSRAQVFSLELMNNKNVNLESDYFVNNKLDKDNLDRSLFILLNRSKTRESNFLLSSYYCNFKKFFLFFLDNFPFFMDKKKLFFFIRNISDECKFFFEDFLFVITMFFLDLNYKKNNLNIIFPLNFLNYFCEKNKISIEKINNILYICKELEQKNNILDDLVCFIMFLIKIEKIFKKEF